MNMLTNKLKKQTMFNEILDCLKNENAKLSFKDIMDPEKAFLVYSLTKNCNKNSVIVCSNILSANKMIQDLKFFSDIEILYYPAKQIIYYDVEAESKEVGNDRMYVLSKINETGKKIIVTTIDALQLPLPQQTESKNLSIYIKKDEEINFIKLAQKLVEMRI